MSRTIITQSDETIDALSWRALGSTRAVEAIYAANPSLAARGPRLPGGLAITVPDEATATLPAPRREIIQLWS